jgi:hypothetical protein
MSSLAPRRAKRRVRQPSPAKLLLQCCTGPAEVEDVTEVDATTDRLRSAGRRLAGQHVYGLSV